MENETTDDQGGTAEESAGGQADTETGTPLSADEKQDSHAQDRERLARESE